MKKIIIAYLMVVLSLYAKTNLPKLEVVNFFTMVDNFQSVEIIDSFVYMANGKQSVKGNFLLYQIDSLNQLELKKSIQIRDDLISVKVLGQFCFIETESNGVYVYSRDLLNSADQIAHLAENENRCKVCLNDSLLFILPQYNREFYVYSVNSGNFQLKYKAEIEDDDLNDYSFVDIEIMNDTLIFQAEGNGFQHVFLFHYDPVYFTDDYQAPAKEIKKISPGNCLSVQLTDTVLYFLTGAKSGSANELKKIEMKKSLDAMITSQYDSIVDFRIFQNRNIVLQRSNSINIYDISNFQSPVLKQNLSTRNWVDKTKLGISAHYFSLAFNENGWNFYQFQNDSLILSDSLSTTSKGGTGMVWQDHWLYFRQDGYLDVFSLSNPISPQYDSSFGKQNSFYADLYFPFSDGILGFSSGGSVLYLEGDFTTGDFSVKNYEFPSGGIRGTAPVKDTLYFVQENTVQKWVKDSSGLTKLLEYQDQREFQAIYATDSLIFVCDSWVYEGEDGENDFTDVVQLDANFQAKRHQIKLTGQFDDGFSDLYVHQGKLFAAGSQNKLYIFDIANDSLVKNKVIFTQEKITKLYQYHNHLMLLGRFGEMIMLNLNTLAAEKIYQACGSFNSLDFHQGYLYSVHDIGMVIYQPHLNQFELEYYGKLLRNEHLSQRSQIHIKEFNEPGNYDKLPLDFWGYLLIKDVYPLD